MRRRWRCTLPGMGQQTATPGSRRGDAVDLAIQYSVVYTDYSAANRLSGFGALGRRGSSPMCRKGHRLTLCLLTACQIDAKSQVLWVFRLRALGR